MVVGGRHSGPYAAISRTSSISIRYLDYFITERHHLLSSVTHREMWR